MVLIEALRSKEVIAGAVFTVVGVALFLGSQQYEIGTAVAMEPGYFPALCGIALVALGLAAVVKGLRAKVIDPIPSHKIEPLFLMILSIVSFGLLIDRAGLVVATFVCLFFACFRRVFTNPIEVFLTYSVLTIFNILVFIYAFGMTIPIFWWEN